MSAAPDYMAPEVIQNVGHGKAADWWSLGILIYEVSHISNGDVNGLKIAFLADALRSTSFLQAELNGPRRNF